MKIVLYKDVKGEFRWKLVARNGKILADCAEGYKEKRKMMRIVWMMLDSVSFLVVDKTGS